jgi:hypothetical protein
MVAPTLFALLATIREGLLEEVPSAQRSALVIGTDEEGHRGYMLLTHSDLPRVDALAIRARYNPGLDWWMHYSYVLESDGYWRCTLPWRRAMDRLASWNIRRAVTMWGLLSGDEVDIEERDALAIARTVVSFAEQEISAEREHRPRDEGKCPCLRCRTERAEAAERRRASIIEGLRRSDAQLDAEAVA